MNSSEEKIKFITIEYPTELGSFQIDVRPFSREQFEKLGKLHRQAVKGRRNRSNTEFELNEETYYPDLYGRLVRGWHGLTGDVKRLICHEVIDVENPDTSEVPFHIDTLVKMCRTSTDFSSAIDEAAIHFDSLYALDIKVKRAKMEEERLEIETKN